MSHVFLSYVTEDKYAALFLRAAIAEAGFKVWMAEPDIDPGDPSWRKTCERAIDNAVCMVLVVSSKTCRSDWVEEEIAKAEDAKKRIIPFLVAGEPGDIPFGLRKVHRLDGRTYPETAIERLIETLQKYYKEVGKEENIKPKRRAEIDVLEGDSVLADGIHYLQNNSCGMVRVFAPTGAWLHDQLKEKWFWTLAYCLANSKAEREGAEQLERLHKLRSDRGLSDIEMPTTRLDSFTGIYGLPPRPRLQENPAGDRNKEREEFRTHLDHMEYMLEPFYGMDSAKLYYLDVDTKSLPGTGAIIIDDTALFIGYATKGAHKVDYGVFLQKQRDIVQNIEHWFVHHLMALTSGNVLQDISKKQVSLDKGFDRIRRRYQWMKGGRGTTGIGS